LEEVVLSCKLSVMKFWWTRVSVIKFFYLYCITLCFYLKYKTKGFMPQNISTLGRLKSNPVTLTVKHDQKNISTHHHFDKRIYNNFLYKAYINKITKVLSVGEMLCYQSNFWIAWMGSGILLSSFMFSIFQDLVCRKHSFWNTLSIK